MDVIRHEDKRKNSHLSKFMNYSDIIHRRLKVVKVFEPKPIGKMIGRNKKSFHNPSFMQT